jgi:hypothetical protein
MAELQFAGQAYQARSTQLIAQQCINAFVETSPKEAKSQVPIYGTPGLSVFARCGKGPVQGLWIMGSLLYVLSGGALYSVTPTGTATLIGQTNLGGVCVLADNGQQLVMVDGFAGWVYQPGGLNQVTTQTVAPVNQVQMTVGGTITNADTISITATSGSISGSPQTVTVTVTGADDTTTLAAALAAAINANTHIIGVGVKATSALAVVTLQWPTTIGIAWLPAVSSGASESLTAGATGLGGGTVIPANITGTITSGDTLQIPLDNGSTFTTTAASTVTAADTAIILTDGVPSQVSAGATIKDSSTTLAQILAPAFKPPCYVCFMDGYFVFAATNTRQFFLSAINDGTQYSGLDFATATANTGFVLAVLNFHEQLLIFTSKPCTEVWYDSGASAFPFQRYDGVYIQRGLSNSLAVASEDNTCFWLGDDGIFYRNNGFLPERISTFAMEHAWAQYPQKYFDCIAFVLDQEGHKFLVCNFISGQATWVFDLSTKLWHQRQSYGSPWV